MKMKNADNTKPKTPLKDKILITIFSIVIAASILFVGGVYLLNTSFLTNNDSDGDGRIDNAINTPAEIKDKCVNFLVAGIANYDNDNGYRGKLTDVIMLVSFDIQAKKINVLQIPRDTYVGEAAGEGKINGIYNKSTDGGIEGLANQVNSMLNVTIDHYVTLNMTAFIKIVDTLGGVEIDVPKRIELEGVVINPGLQKLDGFTAEKFVRERHSYATQDIGRLETQRLFMNAFLKKVFEMNFKDMLALAPTLFKNVTTDLTINQALGFLENLLKVDRTKDINFHMIPFVGARNNSVLSIKKKHLADMLNNYFRPYTPALSSDDLYGVIELVTDYPYDPNDPTV